MFSSNQCHTDVAACSQHLTGFPSLTSLDSVTVTLYHSTSAPVRICNSCNIVCVQVGWWRKRDGRKTKLGWQYILLLEGKGVIIVIAHVVCCSWQVGVHIAVGMGGAGQAVNWYLCIACSVLC